MRVWRRNVLLRVLVLATVSACAHALQTASSPLKRVPTPDPLGPLARAQTAVGEHRWSEADGVLRQYLATHAASADALYLLAATLFHENRPADSLQTYTRAAALRPPSALDLRFVALDYVLLHDYADADRWITRSVAENKGDGESWYAMGRITYTENRFSEAVDSFRKALECMPQSVKAENNLGLALEGLNQPEQALAAYRQAIAWQTGDAHPSEQPLLNLGVLLTNRNALDEALPLLLQAQTLAPKDSKVHTALGKLYTRRLAFAEAQAQFEQAVAAEPNNAALHFQLGQVYRKEGLEVRAKEELTRASALEGTHSSDEGSIE